MGCQGQGATVMEWVLSWYEKKKKPTTNNKKSGQQKNPELIK